MMISCIIRRTIRQYCYIVRVSRESSILETAETGSLFCYLDFQGTSAIKNDIRSLNELHWYKFLYKYLTKNIWIKKNSNFGHFSLSTMNVFVCNFHYMQKALFSTNSTFLSSLSPCFASRVLFRFLFVFFPFIVSHRFEEFKQNVSHHSVYLYLSNQVKRKSIAVYRAWRCCRVKMFKLG